MFNNIIVKQLRNYTKANLLKILYLGIVCATPFTLIGSTLSAWLATSDINKSIIGLFALVGIWYNVKFLWSPIMDSFAVPILSKLGRRKSWIVFSQIVLIFLLIILSSLNPQSNITEIAIVSIFIAFFSATQDIAIDALRIEMLEEKEQGYGAANIVNGYRIGMLIAGAGTLLLADNLGWELSYIIATLPIVIGILVTISIKEAEIIIENKKLSLKLKEAVIEPFKDFVKTQDWYLILLFIILFKLGDAFLSSMTSVFYINIGFTLTNIATIAKSYGALALIIGSIIGGIMINKMSILKALWICGILQMVSNLIFLLQAYMGNNLSILTLTISVENITSGMGAIVFVAYISNLCNKKYTATQYALFSSLAAIGRTSLSSGSGFVVDSIGWQLFFVFSSVLALPGLILLYVIGKNGERNVNRHT